MRLRQVGKVFRGLISWKSLPNAAYEHATYRLNLCYPTSREVEQGRLATLSATTGSMTHEATSSLCSSIIIAQMCSAWSSGVHEHCRKGAEISKRFIAYDFSSLLPLINHQFLWGPTWADGFLGGRRPLPQLRPDEICLGTGQLGTAHIVARVFLAM